MIIVGTAILHNMGIIWGEVTTTPRVPRINNADFDEESYWSEEITTFPGLNGEQARETFRSWMYDGETVSETARLGPVQPELSDSDDD